MNFMGMGFTELAIIFVVAFLALGPAKTIEMARTTGKFIGDLKNTLNDVVAATTVDTNSRPTPQRPEPASRSEPASTTSPADSSEAPPNRSV